MTDAIIDTWFFEDKDWMERYEAGEFTQKGASSSAVSLKIASESWERAKEMARTILTEQMDADMGDVNENATQYMVHALGL